MDVERSIVYGLRYQGRCLTSVRANDSDSQFLVGTLGLHHDNEVHLLTLDEDESQVSGTVYRHPDEVWDIEACPSREDMFMTVAKQSTLSSTYSRAILWRCPPGPTTDETAEETSSNPGTSDQPLEVVASLRHESLDGSVFGVWWGPHSASRNHLLVLEPTRFQVWDMSQGTDGAQFMAQTQARDHHLRRFTTGTWDPQAAQLAVAADTGVQGWAVQGADLVPAFRIPQAHEGDVLDIEYNPNRPHQLATAGEDCKVRIWDVRNLTRPFMTIADHSHWVWSVAYNQFHDQLLLTSGSDCMVNLQSIISISTAAAISAEESTFDDFEANHTHLNHDNSSFEKPTDGLVATFDQHEESVYSVSWSAASPWVFASLSYDGRVVINFVPQEEKYKIIL